MRDEGGNECPFVGNWNGNGDGNEYWNGWGQPPHPRPQILVG
jgi:hypothetical protein